MASFVEVPSSTQDLSYDSDGYMHVSRSFKVWGVNPLTFYKNPTVIPHRDANAAPPVGDRMPDYGHVIDTTNGPGVNGAEGGAEGVSAKVKLYEYILQPTGSPGGLLYLAIARYSNDPKRTPHGVDFATTQQTTFVPIPYVRKVEVIGGTSSIAYIESLYQAPMAIERVSHAVTVPRSELKAVEAAITRNIRSAHELKLRSGMEARFDGADISMRGVQYLNIRYHWTYEFGVQQIDPDMVKVVKVDGSASTSVNLIFPPAIVGLQATTVNRNTKYVLPPYHTIDMLWDYQTSSPYTKSPVWQYRYLRTPNGTASSLPGSEQFIWN